MSEAEIKDNITRILMQNGGANNLPEAVDGLYALLLQLGVQPQASNEQPQQ